MNACDHAKLRFLSGGFYVLCSSCGARWTATKDHGTQLDHGRVEARLDQQLRVKP